MIVKFLPNKGGGSAKATMNYMLGKDRDREGAKLLRGNPLLTERLADNLDFKNRYTVGVLSFEESNITEHQKHEIMARFEESLLAGLDPDQYDITWIEHNDKGRLELNFIIPNVELSTGKRLQPYYHKSDMPITENFKQVINYEYGLSDPNDPDKQKAVKIDVHNLPQNLIEIKDKIGQAISSQIESGAINDQQGVVDTLKNAGFEIARITEKSISIKNPDGKRNIRLEGAIYENRQFDSELGKEYRTTKSDYKGQARQRYDTAYSKLQSNIERKRAENQKHFGKSARDNQTTVKRNQISDKLQNATRGLDGLATGVNDGARAVQPVSIQKHWQTASDIERDTAEHRAVTATGSSLVEGGNQPEPRQINLDNAQKSQKSGSWQISQRQADHETGVTNYAKRLYNRLQQFTQSITSTVNRLGGGQYDTERADREIEQQQQWIDYTARFIDKTGQEIDERERQFNETKQSIIEHQRTAEQFTATNIREIQKAIERELNPRTTQKGMDR
jgi:hypothetical protein